MRNEVLKPDLSRVRQPIDPLFQEASTCFRPGLRLLAEPQVSPKYQSRLEDVKKLISLSSRDFIFDPRCLPTHQRSLIGHPGDIL